MLIIYLVCLDLYVSACYSPAIFFLSLRLLLKNIVAEVVMGANRDE